MCTLGNGNGYDTTHALNHPVICVMFCHPILLQLNCQLDEDLVLTGAYWLNKLGSRTTPGLRKLVTIKPP